MSKGERDKIAIIANGFQVDYIVHLSNALADLNIPVDLIGSDIYPVGQLSPKVRFLNLRGAHDEQVSFTQKFKRIIRYYRKLTKYILLEKPAVVHIQWLRFFIMDGIIMPWFFKLNACKVIYTIHNVLPHDRDSRCLRFIFSRIYKLPHHLILHTQFLADQSMELFKIKAARISIVKHGVYELKKGSAEVIHKNPDELSLLFFGRINAYKGLDLILEAIQELKAEIPLSLTIAGKPFPEYVEGLEGLIQQSNELIDKLLLRYISDEEVDELFRKSDLCLLPYREASQSGVLFMAYAYGTPVVVSRLGAFPEDVQEGKTGYLCEANSASSLRDAIRKAWYDKQEGRAPDRNYIQSYARENYSWDSSAQQLVKIYYK